MIARPSPSRTAAAVLFTLCLATQAGLAAEPDSISGLVAWYSADSMQKSLSRGDSVSTWADLSGNGHDLTADRKGLPALFTPQQVNGLPAVQVRKGESYTVAAPFELGEHTIFLVYRADAPGRVLFRSKTDKLQGVILRAEGNTDQLQTSSPIQTTNYGTTTLQRGKFGVTVLGREAGFLKAFINGTDVSVGAEFPGVMDVGKFFHLDHSQYAKSDGDGLRIAEMIFYNRYLSGGEREVVTRYLSDKYAIDVERHEETTAAAAAAAAASGAVMEFLGVGLAQLSTNSKADINGGMAVIEWDLVDVLDPPFQHDITMASRLVCGQDGTRVRLYVSLPLSSTVPGANIRIMFMMNGSSYQRGEGRSGPFGGPGAEGKRTVRAEVIVSMNRGDYIEILALREGAEGPVTIDQSMAVFIAETR
jgi:hypothetical protein